MGRHPILRNIPIPGDQNTGVYWTSLARRLSQQNQIVKKSEGFLDHFLPLKIDTFKTSFSSIITASYDHIVPVYWMPLAHKKYEQNQIVVKNDGYYDHPKGDCAGKVLAGKAREGIVIT